MFNFNHIAFRIPFLFTLISFALVVALMYLSMEKLSAAYETAADEGVKSSMKSILLLVTERAQNGDCEGIKLNIGELVASTQIEGISVDLSGASTECRYHVGTSAFQAKHAESVFVYDIDGNKIGDLWVAYSLDSLFHAQQVALLKPVAIVVLIFFLILVLIARLLVYALKPLSVISDAMASFDPANPEPLVLHRVGDDEVSELVRSAGSMYETLVAYAKRIHATKENSIYTESHLKEAQRMANLGSWEYHVSSDTFMMSTEMYRMLSINAKSEQITWNQFLAFVAEGDRAHVYKVINDAIEHGSKFHLGYQIKTAQGQAIEVHTYGKVRKKALGNVRVTGVTRDVTEHNRTQRMIEQLAYFDPLTHLPNRVLLRDRLHKAIDTAKRNHTKLAVLFLDLDHFKLVNDSLGHNVGDSLLCYVSELLNEHLRGSDTLSRMGGDEFVILLPQISGTTEAERVAEKLVRVLDGQHVIEHHQLYISGSIGVAIFPDHAEEVGDMIKCADTAMFAAKQKGRKNWQTYDPEMTGQEYGQLMLEEELYDAAKHKEVFALFYQPQIDNDTMKVCGFEALLRWHNHGQVLEPDQFIPLMESTGLIIEIGHWVIERVVEELSKWQKQGRMHITLWVNLSARQLHDEKLPEFVEKIIALYGIDPACLGFEVSESILVSNIEDFVPQMEHLKEIGVHLAVDNYGSGYSSIDILAQFPLDTLKIGQRFVREIFDEEDEVRKIHAIAAMAKALGLTTVIEGVENEAQLNKLKEIPYGLVQGYLYSRPLSLQGVEEYLADTPE